MRLDRLLVNIPTLATRGSMDIGVMGLAYDSRQVQPGELFVAIPGQNADGHDFIPDAVRRGAVAVVGEREPAKIALPVPYVQVTDSRLVLALLAAAWYGHPGQRLRVVGVTGTDGKTTTVRLIGAMLEAAGHRVGLVSTVSALIGGREVDTGFHTTTPDALQIQGYLAAMLAADAEYVVIEATSHGLAQHRVTGCEFDVAVVTNITHEHLDYHSTYEEYRAAKGLLFRSLTTSYRKPGTPKVAVLNADDEGSFEYLRAMPADRQIIYGLEAEAEVSARDITLEPLGSRFTLIAPGLQQPITTSLLGRFNVYNILASASAAFALGVPGEAIAEGVQRVHGVTGRMERIEMGQDFTVIVDFAHTPNALARALETVRPLTSGRLIVVFGCAGQRDRTKRPLMGEIAGRLADITVLTAEDPRTEDVGDIISQIAAGCEAAGRTEGEGYFRVPDRAEAIAFAVNMARRGDLVLVTGKGHERSMCFGTVEYPWNEHEVVRAALAKRLGL